MAERLEAWTPDTRDRGSIPAPGASCTLEQGTVLYSNRSVVRRSRKAVGAVYQNCLIHVKERHRLIRYREGDHAGLHSYVITLSAINGSR